MHARRIISTRIAVIFSVSLTAAMLIIGGGLWLGSHNSSAKPGQETVQVIQQPPTAAQVAQSENCTQFTDAPVTSTANSLGVIDAGTCWVDGKKYGLDTFVTPATRDSWLKISEPFGVVPKWETATSVTYPSTSK